MKLKAGQFLNDDGWEATDKLTILFRCWSRKTCCPISSTYELASNANVQQQAFSTLASMTGSVARALPTREAPAAA